MNKIVNNEKKGQDVYLKKILNSTRVTNTRRENSLLIK